MTEKEQPSKNAMTIYTFLDMIKSKLPDGYKDEIYKGIHIGLKTNYIRYLNGLENYDPCIKYHYYLFCKDSKNRKEKPSNTNEIETRHYKYTKHKVWLWVCGNTIKMPFYCLGDKTKQSLLKYISEHDILQETYCDGQSFREREVFFFDDTNIKTHLAKY